MPKMIHQETLCGYKRCCPVVKIFDDGSVEISDDDVDLGSVGTLKISPEAAADLLELLSKHKP